MVPVAAVPPVTPFTCQITAAFVVPVTVAENCVVEPMRVADAPETTTAICGAEEPLQPARPRRTAENRTAEAQRARIVRDMEDLHTSRGSATFALPQRSVTPRKPRLEAKLRGLQK